MISTEVHSRLRFHALQYAFGLFQVPAFQTGVSSMLFSAYLDELVGTQENLRVLLETGDLSFFFGEEAESDFSFFFGRGSSIEEGGGSGDPGRIIFFFALQPRGERLGPSDHEGAVEHEEILLWDGACSSLWSGTCGRGEIKETQEFIGCETVPISADGGVEGPALDVEYLVGWLSADFSVKFPGDGQQAVAPDLDLHSSGAHSPQQAVVSILIEVLRVEAAASLVGGG